MEQFLDEIRCAATAEGIEPALLIKRAAANSVSGQTWAKWVADEASPTMRLVDRVRAYIAEREAARAAEAAAAWDDAAEVAADNAAEEPGANAA